MAVHQHAEKFAHLTNRARIIVLQTHFYDVTNRSTMRKGSQATASFLMTAARSLFEHSDSDLERLVGGFWNTKASRREMLELQMPRPMRVGFAHGIAVPMKDACKCKPTCE
jgi:hypothetical protein